MNLQKSSKLAVILPAFVIGALGGGAFTHYVIDRSQTSNSTDSVTNNNSALASKNSPLSPSAVVLGVSQYLNKEIKVGGYIADAGSGSYTIIGQDKSKPFALALDFSQATSIDPAKYVSTSSASEVKDTAPKQVVATGKLTEIKNGDTSVFKLVISDIQ